MKTKGLEQLVKSAEVEYDSALCALIVDTDGIYVDAYMYEDEVVFIEESNIELSSEDLIVIEKRLKEHIEQVKEKEYQTKIEQEQIEISEKKHLESLYHSFYIG